MRPEAGFSLLAAIFLLVVLSALGTFMLVFSGVQHAASAQDVQGSRAYHAARSGIEWGLYQVLSAGSCPASTNLSVGAGAGGSDFTVSVLCAVSGSAIEAGATVSVYQVTATACNVPSAGACPGAAGGLAYVERQVRATVSR